MEKIILAIVVLNILASLLLKKKKKAAKAPGPRPRKPAMDDRAVPRDKNPQEDKTPVALKKGLASGKDLLKEMVKEFGVELPQAQKPPQPVRQPAPWKPEPRDIDEFFEMEMENEEDQEEGFETKEEVETQEQHENVMEEWDTAPRKRPVFSPNIKGVPEQKMHPYLEQLNSGDNILDAIILKTILDPPLALQRKPGRLVRY